MKIEIRKKTSEEVMAGVTKILIENQELKSKVELLEAEIFIKNQKAINASDTLNCMLADLRSITKLVNIITSRIAVITL
jgi:hypothetical protein